jgi:Tfp pilus assembly protein PilF
VEVQGLLAQDPSNGPANLTMARILVKQNRIGEAAFYYHRSIYGRWPENAPVEHLHVRLELVDLLAQQNDKQDLLAELLPLQDENFDPATRQRIAYLYLKAGSPNRAADMFHEILHQQPSNAQAFAGLGSAEFAKGNYRAARANFLNASRIQPSNADYRRQLDISAKVLELDPMLRGLGSHERYLRSTRLLEIASDSVSSCPGANAAQDAHPLLDAAQSALTARITAKREDDATNANLDLAEKLFAIRKKDCNQPLNDNEEPAALALAKAQ